MPSPSLRLHGPWPTNGLVVINTALSMGFPLAAAWPIVSYDDERDLLPLMMSDHDESDFELSTDSESDDGTCDVPGCTEPADGRFSDLPDALRRHLCAGEDLDFPLDPAAARWPR